MGIIIDFDLSTILISALIWVSIIAFLRLKRKKPAVYLFFFTIFFIYIITVFKYTQFPIYFIESMRAYGQNVWTNMNFIPFITLGYQDLQSSVFNILLTIPFGFGLPFITHFRIRQVIIYSTLFTITLEALQLLTALMAGHTFRVVDINDVLFNITGAIIGYILFIAFIHAVRFTLSRLPIELNIILRYVCERPQISKDYVSTSSTNSEKNI